MTDSVGTVAASRSHHDLLNSARVLSACAAGAALMLIVGWMAMAPLDPLGTVSLLSRNGAGTMLLHTAAVAGVAAAVATLIAGRCYPDAGTLSVCLGLAIASLQGATSEHLLLEAASDHGMGHRALALMFVAESFGWLAVLAVAALSSAVILQWVYDGAPAREPELLPSAHRVRLGLGFDLPFLSGTLFGTPADRQTHTRRSLLHLGAAAVLALALLTLLSPGHTARVIRHGQVCFVVAASFFLSTYAAVRWFPVRSAVWALLAVPLAAVAGYVWAAVAPADSNLPPNIPSSHFLRSTPLQFVSVGGAAAIFSFWRFSRSEMVEHRGHGGAHGSAENI